MKAVVVEFDPSTTEFPETSLYSKKALDDARIPGNRPMIPAWHLVDDVIKLTYWQAVRYYSNVLIAAHIRDRASTLGEAKEFVEWNFEMRNARIEASLIYLLGTYPPFIKGERGFPRKRAFQLVRNRTSECPQPPEGEEQKVEVQKAQNDFMGPAPSFYLYLKFEASRYKKTIQEFAKLSDKYPDMSGIRADIEKMKGRVADLEAFVAARPPRT